MYAVSGSLPGSLIIDAGTVAGDSTGDKTASMTDTTLPAGTYMLIAVASAAISIRAVGSGPVPNPANWFGGRAGPLIGSAGRYITTTGWTTPGALPASASLTSPTYALSGDLPLIVIRRTAS